jgi:hypothetical protein
MPLLPSDIPDDPKERRGPIPSKLVHQAQDVLVDRRGVIYMKYPVMCGSWGSLMS